MKKIIAIALLSVASLFAQDQVLDSLFTVSNINGTIVIASLDGSTQYIHNPDRASLQVLPASTFKIPNSLIALQEGVVSINDTIPWDSVTRSYPQWNQDQTLETAFKSSCVPVYQQFASKIGIAKYHEYLSALDYGNREIGTDTTGFWLTGEFAISPLEQIDFLRGVINQSFPFSPENYGILKNIMINEQTDEYTIYAKTGWATQVPEQHGWFVGYVESAGKVWIFATNIITPNGAADLGLRKEITVASLRAKGIL